MAIVAPTATRVAKHTTPAINRRISLDTYARLERIGNRRAAIQRRLEDLDQEWDIERAIEMNASSLILAGTVFGLTVSKRFFALPLVVSTFLLQHAVQGWCPPVPVLRRLGFRTEREISDERHELLKRLEAHGEAS